nr:Putative 1-acylglycerol-3-phosphate O-acyltransferase [uncultured bacterium]
MKLLAKSLLFYFSFALFFVLLLPFLAIALYVVRDRRLAQCIAKVWTQVTCVMMQRCVGLSYHLDGFEKIHQSPVPMIIASKHQSIWDVGALELEFGEKAVFVIKKELKRIPFFGRMMTLIGAIAIDRKKPVQAIRQMLDEAKKEVANNHSHIIIFPEGRRTAVGETADYTDGVYLLYKNLNMPVAAVALNSGLYWPRRHFLKYPGIIEAKVMEIIPPGLDRDSFRDRLVNAIESGSLELINSHTLHDYQSHYIGKKHEVAV